MKCSELILSAVLIAIVGALICGSWLGLRRLHNGLATLRGVAPEVAERHYRILTIIFASAICMYLLIAAIFAGYYTLVDQSQHFNNDGCSGRNCNFADFMYFSVITLATVGYGDIHPTSWGMRLVVSLEVLTGLILIGVALGLLLSIGPDFAKTLATEVGNIMDRLQRRRSRNPDG